LTRVCIRSGSLSQPFSIISPGTCSEYLFSPSVCCFVFSPPLPCEATPPSNPSICTTPLTLPHCSHFLWSTPSLGTTSLSLLPRGPGFSSLLKPPQLSIRRHPREPVPRSFYIFPSYCLFLSTFAVPSFPFPDRTPELFRYINSMIYPNSVVRPGLLDANT